MRVYYVTAIVLSIAIVRGVEVDMLITPFTEFSDSTYYCASIDLYNASICVVSVYAADARSVILFAIAKFLFSSM